MTSEMVAGCREREREREHSTSTETVHMVPTLYVPTCDM